jgi:putative lipase involved disintegration of autophagic bodies
MFGFHKADEVFSESIQEEINTISADCCTSLVSAYREESRLNFAVEIRVSDEDPNNPGIIYEATVGTKEFRSNDECQVETISYTHYDVSELVLPDINIEEMLIEITVMAQRRFKRHEQDDLDWYLGKLAKEIKMKVLGYC